MRFRMRSPMLTTPTVSSCRSHAETHSSTYAPIQRIELWSPWGGRRRPSTAAEERAFVDRLRQLAASEPSAGPSSQPPRRIDYTVVVTALRNAVTADEMLRIAPGLKGGATVAAYADIDFRRARSVRAWRMLAADSTRSTFEEVGGDAARLLPDVITRLRQRLCQRPGDALGFRRAVSTFNSQIHATHVRALDLEDMLTGSPGTARADHAADLLHDSLGEGIWNLSTFLAPRVGTLVTARLNALLHE